MAIIRFRQFALTCGGQAKAVVAGTVGGRLLPGRAHHPRWAEWFSRGGGQPRTIALVILSDDFWKAQFGGSRDILGRTLTLTGALHIVGVMPPEFSVASPGL